MEVASIFLSFLTTAIAIWIAWRQLGHARSLREVSESEEEIARALVTAVTVPGREPVPFETEQLSHYYAQVLAQSKTTFWFSLAFASLGFVVILAAAFLHTGDAGVTVAQGTAGVVIDAVAALFFVQSKRAQKSMAEFFDKLRKDRQQAESRVLCESIERDDLQDALRTQLSLYYAGIPDSAKVAQGMLSSVRGWTTPHVSPEEAPSDE